MNREIFKEKYHQIIQTEVGALEQGTPILPFFTEGRWDSVQMLYYILSFTGPAKVTAVTFSISENAVAKLANAKRFGYITRLNLMLHGQMRNNRTDVFFFARKVADEMHTAELHEKLYIVENDNWNVAVSQSANLTDNPAWESGIISTCPKVFEKYKNQITKIQTKAQKIK